MEEIEDLDLTSFVLVYDLSKCSLFSLKSGYGSITKEHLMGNVKYSPKTPTKKEKAKKRGCLDAYNDKFTSETFRFKISFKSN